MRKVFAVAVLLFLLLTVSSVQANQVNRVDLGVIRHITQPFIEALANKNIAVKTSYQCGTHYRKDWGSGTYMMLSGKAFPWTDATGTAHLDLFTLNPPMSLEGFRPPMTLNTAPVDADGNIVVGDPQYWIRYRVWQTRPCVRFSSLLQENQGVANAWNYWVQDRTDMSKYRNQWVELGLNPDGTAPRAYDRLDPYAWQGDAAFEQVNWSGAPNYLTPVESVQQEDIGEGIVTWKESFDFTKAVISLAVAILLIGFFLVSVRRRNSVLV